MYLNREEQDILEGKKGEIKAKALKLLVEIGKQNGAEELVDIQRSHISGVSYKTAGDPYLQLLEDMTEAGIHVSTHATVNPAGMPRKGWEQLGIPKKFARKQRRIINAYKKLNCEMIFSCTPYSIYPPRKGEIVAFAESSAVAYVNSVIGAKSNRHGSLDALSASITGKVPKMGLLFEENRKPSVLFKVNFSPSSQMEFSLLGLYVGKKVEKGKNPAFSFPSSPHTGDLKALGGGLATSGSVALFHVLGVTPEVKNTQINDLIGVETINVTKKAFRQFIDEKKAQIENPDLIALGCPHISLKRLKKIARKIEGRKVLESTKMWLFVSEGVIQKAQQEVLEPIKKAGAQIINDMCPVVAPLKQIGIESVVTDSGKAFSYIPRLSSGVEAYFAPLDEIVKRWTK